MKFTYMIIAFAATFATSNLVNACQATVMGGCVQEPTHDTSSHMKSQIVNKVEHAEPSNTAQASNESNTKLNAKSGAKKSANSAHSSTAGFVKAATQAVIK